MTARIRDLARDESGSTMTELLVTTVVVAVVAAVGVSTVGALTGRGELAACASDRETVETAQQTHYLQAASPTYAGSVDELVAAGLLRAAPANNRYTITTSATGAVTVVGGPAGC